MRDIRRAGTSRAAVSRVSEPQTNVQHPEGVVTFSEVLKSTKRANMEALVRRAAGLNRLAKMSTSSMARSRLYAEKARTLSRLIVLDAVRVVEMLPQKRLVTVELPAGGCLHVPVAHLVPDARRAIARKLAELLSESV